MGLRIDELHDDYLLRKRTRAGFRYVWPNGKAYRQAAGLQRIASLAIPPAWDDVHVSPEPEAELQAWGTDAAGRRQYRYHPEFMEQGARRKWQRLKRFALALADLRAATRTDLRLPGLPLRKVLALITRLLHVGFFRVGNPRYTQAHGSHGLTTLCKKHLCVQGNVLMFEFKGKHGVLQKRETTDRALAPLLQEMLALPGRWLFQYVDDEGQRRPVRAAQVNAYLREVMGAFSAKDFRTWGGTLRAAEFLSQAPPADTERDARRTLLACVKAVAEELGNTAAVTRGSYICPVVFDRYFEGKCLHHFAPAEPLGSAALTLSEQALQRMLAARQSRKRGVSGSVLAGVAPATPAAPAIGKGGAKAPAKGAVATAVNSMGATPPKPLTKAVAKTAGKRATKPTKTAPTLAAIARPSVKGASARRAAVASSVPPAPVRAPRRTAPRKDPAAPAAREMPSPSTGARRSASPARKPGVVAA